MQNRPTNLFQQSFEKPDGRPWHVDGHPGMRLVWLFVLLVLPLAAVAVRVVSLQYFLAGRFLADASDRTTVTLEAIPSRDGRILSGDGRVLAYDIERFSVRMHFRWLEEPADPDWLRRQALSRLDRDGRGDPKRVEAAEQAVLRRRRQTWKRLADHCTMSLKELRTNRRAVQNRVERIVSTVERRRRERAERQRSTRQAERQRELAGASWWTAAWKTFVNAITTSPARRRLDPIVVQEEFEYHEVIDDVGFDVAATIEAHAEEYPGLRIRVKTKRVYPEKSLASHVIGVRTRISEQELEARDKDFPEGDPLDYRPGDSIGKAGAEKSYDRRIRGLRGVRRVIKDPRGELIRTETLREPRIGQDIVLTLSVALQERAESLLDDVLGDKNPHETEGAEAAQGSTVSKKPPGGCVVAVDVHTGAVLAAACGPRYDLNLMVDTGVEEWKRVTNDPRHPLFPRLTQMTVAPGSVFKALTAVAVAESGEIDPDATVFCRGYLDHPNRYRCYVYRHYGYGHGDMTLTDALCRSCNVYFFTAAREVGAVDLCRWAARFGFGQPTGIDLPDEHPGNLPLPPQLRDAAGPQATRRDAEHHRRQAHQHPWYPGDTLGLAIGQSRLTVTPLQVVRLMAAIANGGYLVTPHVTLPPSNLPAPPQSPSDNGLRTAGFDEIEWNSQPRPVPGLSPETLDRVREGLEQVVANPRGTGYRRVRLKEIAIAGKTGTAEVGGGKKDHAWFAGFAPAERPRVAFAVVLQHAGSGGTNAGPVARQLVQAMLELGLLRPTQVSRRE